MGNQNQDGNKERLGEVDANAPTQPQDTRGPRSRRSGLASHLGPHSQWPPWRGTGLPVNGVRLSTDRLGSPLQTPLPSERRPSTRNGGRG